MRNQKQLDLIVPSLINGTAVAVLVLLVSACGVSAPQDEGAGVFVAAEVMSMEALDAVTLILDAAFTSDGDAWILNTQTPFLLLQSPAGEVVESFGQPGDGPDEMGFPAAIVNLERDSVVVLDRERRAFRTFDRRGTEINSVPVSELATSIPRDLGEATYGEPFRATVVGGFVLTSHYPEARAPGTSHLWNREVVRIDLSTGEMSAVLDFREARDRYAAELGGAAILMPIPLWAACADGSVVQYMPFADSLSWFDTVRPPSSVAATPRPLDPEEVRVTVRGGIERRMPARGMSGADVDDMLPMALEQLGDEISSLAPAYANMMCGPGPLLWLQTFSVEDDWIGRGRIWHVLDTDGEILARVELPPRFRPVEFRDDILFGVQRDAYDVERLGAVSWDGIGADQ